MTLLLTCLLAACGETPWDPEVAVTVNGLPISKAALDRVLELGFHPTVTDDETRAPDLSLGQILDKLITERLILDEAAKAGLAVSEEELSDAAAFYGTAWFGAAPPPAELGEMKDALRNQLLLRKMTERVIRENRTLSAEDWRAFWQNWPKERPVHYQVRVLSIPPLAEAPSIPARSAKSLGDMVEYLAKEGLEVFISDSLWIGGRNISPEEAAAIEEALAKKSRTKAFRLAESWVIYEPLAVDRGPGEAAALLRAQAAFEELEGEKVFQNWLTGIRAAADIRINPAYLEISEPPVEDENFETVSIAPST